MENNGNFVGAHTLLALIAVLLVIPNSCMAATLAKTNSSYRCNGGLGGCLIADDFELEFIMDSHFSRILAGGVSPDPKAPGSGDRRAVPCTKGRGNPYGSCEGEKHPDGRCGQYARPPCK